MDYNGQFEGLYSVDELAVLPTNKMQEKLPSIETSASSLGMFEMEKHTLQKQDIDCGNG